jgi:hypothetical protein
MQFYATAAKVCGEFPAPQAGTLDRKAGIFLPMAGKFPNLQGFLHALFRGDDTADRGRVIWAGYPFQFTEIGFSVRTPNRYGKTAPNE